MHELRTHNLHALEDFTQASENELMARPRVGRATIVQIHSYLQALGLDFKPTPHPGRVADIKTELLGSFHRASDASAMSRTWVTWDFGPSHLEDAFRWGSQWSVRFNANRFVTSILGLAQSHCRRSLKPWTASA
jgi:hypothetical protein